MDDDITLFCLVQGNAIAQAFPLSIDRNESVGQLKKAIKAKKTPEFNFIDADMLKLWKVHVHDVVDLSKLTFRDYDQLFARRKISSYFTDKPFDNHIHIVVKPPKLIHFSLELTLKAGFLTEGGNVEYLGKDCIYKATLREGCLCTKDGKYRSFIEFIRVARGLKPDEIPIPYDFHSLIINGMTYWEVRDKIYKFVSYKNEDNLFIDHLSIPWSDDLEKRLRQLYAKGDIVDIFWGRSLKDDDTTWRVYIVYRNICHLCKRTENVKEDQMIRFIVEEEGFANAKIRRRSPHDPLPTLKKIPIKLQKVFDEALDKELGQSFRKMHYNLVGMSTGYKQIRGEFTEVPAIILYVRQKGILRRGCDRFPDNIRGYSVDVVEACAATPYGFGVSSCQAYQENVKLGSSIGIIESQGTSGTLSAIVHDKNSARIGILSCEHVCKFSESSIGTGVIYQPSHKDLDDLKQSFGRMASEAEAYREISEKMCHVIDGHRQNSALARYERGMRNNFYSKAHQKNFGIDATFCIFANKNRTLCPNKLSILPEDFKKANLPENTCINGFYKYEELNNNYDFDDFDVFKVGRATGLTLGKLLPIGAAVSINLTKESIKFAKEQGEIPPYSNNVSEGIFIGYMKSPLIQEMNEMHQQCYPTVWFDRQLVFAFEYGGFEPGDSGASVVNKRGKALGILHAAWMTDNYRYAIASPYFAVFEALNVVEIDSYDNITLDSDK